jgi:hypothetical protein
MTCAMDLTPQMEERVEERAQTQTSSACAMGVEMHLRLVWMPAVRVRGLWPTAAAKMSGVS